MDSSDGLSTTLNEMAARSGVAIIVDGDPAAAGVAGFAARHGLDPDNLVYHGGEEYEIVFALRPGGINDIFSAVRNSRTPLRYIGRVEEGEGVYLEREGRSRLPDEGWKAF
jgi:thiamine-monophosphate kinase